MFKIYFNFAVVHGGGGFQRILQKLPGVYLQSEKVLGCSRGLRRKTKIKTRIMTRSELNNVIKTVLLNSCILNEYEINFDPFKNIVRIRVYINYFLHKCSFTSYTLCRTHEPYSL